MILLFILNLMHNDANIKLGALLLFFHEPYAQLTIRTIIPWILNHTEMFPNNKRSPCVKIISVVLVSFLSLYFFFFVGEGQRFHRVGLGSSVFRFNAFLEER